MQYAAYGKVSIHEADSNKYDRYRSDTVIITEVKTLLTTFQGETVSVRFYDVNTVPVRTKSSSDTVLT